MHRKSGCHAAKVRLPGELRPAPGVGATPLSSFQTELLLALYEQQYRYRTGNWSFDGTIWSRASYQLASAHDALRPSPAQGRKNMSREFEARMTRTRQQLKTQRLVKTKVIRAHDAPAKYAQGYKRHRARDTDTFLTEAGLRRAETELRTRGLMAEAELARCTEAPEPDGPLAADLAGCE